MIFTALRPHLHNKVYVESFFGSGALGLSLAHPRAIYVDSAPDLANLYTEVRDRPHEVLTSLAEIELLHGEEVYYQIRESVWPENRLEHDQKLWAAHTIWLNKSCFNGLRRVDSRGRFNVPWGRRDNVVLPSSDHVLQVSAALQGSHIGCGDFGDTLTLAVTSTDPKDLVVYLDPPYADRLEDEAGARAEGGACFTGYAGKFAWADQVRLAKWAQALRSAGALVIASNTWSDRVLSLYEDFRHFRIGVRHSVGADAESRGKRAEMLAVSGDFADEVEMIIEKMKGNK